MAGIAFLIGVLFGQFSTWLPPWWLAAGLVPVGALWAWQRPRQSAFSAALLGYAWLVIIAQLHLADRLPPELEGQDLVVSGSVVSVPEHNGRRLRFLFDVDAASHQGQSVPLQMRVRLSWYDRAAQLRAGDRWRFSVRLRSPRGFANPHGFDYAGWLFRHAIRATGYVRKAPAAAQLGASPSLHRARQWLGERIELALALHGEPRQPGLLRALSIGQRDGLSPALWEDLRATGTNHLVAISGLHIGLVAGLVSLLAALLWRWTPVLQRRVSRALFATVAACPAALLYAALAGFSVPTQRALAMFSVALLALLLRRRLSATRGLGLALLAVLLIDPLAPMGLDFWLSFAAVAVILLSFSGRWLAVRDWRQWPRLQIAVSLGLLPLTLLFFNHGSLIAPLVNLLAVPVMGVALLPLTLFGALLACVDVQLASVPLWLADRVADGLVGALSMAAAAPLASWQQAAPTWWAAALAMLGILLLVLPSGFAARWLTLPLCLPALLWGSAGPRSGSFQLELLDVGQGLAVLVRTADHALLYDGGARFSATFDAGSAVVLPHLRGEGIRQLDRVVASHADNDHRGGLPAVLTQVSVGELLASFDWPDAGMPVRRCRRGERWQWAGVTFEFLHPGVGWVAGNDASCVLRIEAADGSSALLSGDIERAAELSLLATTLPPSEVLVVPHHGSLTSSSEAFVEAVEPRWALFALGHRNRYGFPRKEVLARYQRRDVQILRSDRDGAVGLLLGEGEPRLLYRARDRQAYWTDTHAWAE